jgi:hypothetical protein
MKKAAAVAARVLMSKNDAETTAKNLRLIGDNKHTFFALGFERMDFFLLAETVKPDLLEAVANSENISRLGLENYTISQFLEDDVNLERLKFIDKHAPNIIAALGFKKSAGKYLDHTGHSIGGKYGLDELILNILRNGNLEILRIMAEACNFEKWQEKVENERDRLASHEDWQEYRRRYRGETKNQRS